MDTLGALVAFSTTDTIGHIRLRKIRQSFPKVEDFFSLSSGEMSFFLESFSERALRELASMAKRGEIAQQLCAKKDIRILPVGHPDYPPLLRSIPDPPFVLYVRGNLDNSVPLAAVIGTRKSTPDAEETNRWFCSSFAQYGIGVVSGLAAGHDSIAADAVLREGGYTVAVMGTAVDKPYPSVSEPVYRRILETGAIVSEYPPGTEGAKWRFPRRNRIVSGMSRAVFVVQAPELSGTLITVRMALEQGRDVYAMPGNPRDAANRGSNRMLQMGAKLALSPEEIIKELLQEFPGKDTRRFIKKAAEASQKVPQKEPEPDASLSPEENALLAAATDWAHADDLLRATGLDASLFNALATMLEIKGKIQQKPGRLYKRSS